MRRLLRIAFRIVLGLLAALVIALLALPWWISFPLRPILARYGVTYATYSSGGYAKFILTDVRVATSAADVSVARVETDTPLVLLFRRFTSSPGPVSIDGYTITLKPAPKSEPQTPPATAPEGLLATRDLAENLRAQIAPWLPALTLTNGKIHLSPDEAAPPIAIAAITLTQNAAAAKIDIDKITHQDHRAGAKITWDTSALTLQAKLNTADTLLSLTLADNQLDCVFQTFGQTAAFAAHYAPDGWLPTEACLNAPDLSLDANRLAQLKLPHYTTATGKLLVDYSHGRITADISAHADATSDNSALDIALQAEGTTEQIDITTLDIALPFLAAKLSAPVTITRDLRLLTPASRFALEADLSKQPWLPDTTGRITGEASFNTTDLGKLNATARFDAENIRVKDVAITRAALALTQQNFLTTLTQLQLVLGNDSQLNATGRYDAGARELHEVKLDARVRQTDIADFLPPNLTFDEASLALTAEGKDTAPAHKGTLEIKNARAPGLANPAHIAADWQGRAITLDSLNLALTAATTGLRLSAADISPDRATLTAFVLDKNSAEQLRLLAPATLTRAPENTFTLTPLTLASPGNASKLSLHAVISPGVSSLALSATGIGSALFGDLFDTGPLPWEILHADITANLSGPDAPLTGSVALDARLDYAPVLPGYGKGETVLPGSALINTSASLTATGLEISRLTVSEVNSQSLIAHISGSFPVTIRPAGKTPLFIDKNASVALDAHTQPESPFWQNLSKATGIIMESPRINAHLEGSLQKPVANADISIMRLALDPSHWPAQLPKLPDLPPLPPITNLAARLRTDATTLTLETFSLEIAGQPLRATGSIPLSKNTGLLTEATFSAELVNADLAALAPYSANTLSSRGNLSLSLQHAPGQPLTGSLQIRDAALRPLAPLGIISGINTDARLRGRRLEITSATALIGNQPATVTGTVDFPEGGGAPGFLPDLAVKAANIPFVREPGMLVRGDIDLGIQTTDTKAGVVPLLKGSVTLRDSLFLADLRSLWGSRPASGPASRPPFFAIETPPLNNWQLDIDVRGPGFLRIDTTVFAGKLSAAFKLDGTLGDPRLVGDATVDSGKVLFPFATFTTQTGRVRLTQASPHMPSIEFAATSRTLGYDLRMELDGTAENPRLKFTSSPALSSEQILLFVMAGETPNNEVDYTNQQRALSLGTYLGQSFVYELFGLSSEEGRLTLTSGEKLTRQGRETYNVEYKLSDRWSGVGEYDEFDAYNLGLKWLAYRSKPPATTPADTPKQTAAKTDGGKKNTPPKIKVSGRGVWKNLTGKRMLQRTLALNGTHGPALTTNEVEDASFLLVSQLVADGYMHPKLELAATNAEAAVKTYSTDETLNLEIPRDLAAKELRIQITPGTRYKLRDVTFEGQHSITDDEARQFFLPAAGLFGDPSIPYSPESLKRCLSALQESLRQKGYAEAAVKITDLKIDDSTGRVAAHVAINEGPLWQISEITAKIPDDANVGDLSPLTSKLKHDFAAKPWSQWTQQDIAEMARQHYYKLGHPDVFVQVAHTNAAGGAKPGSHPVAVEVRIAPGLQVRIASIVTQGNRHTRESLVRRRIRLEPGDPLNPLALEAARHRLSSLGTFRSIDLDYEPAGGALRSAHFNLVETPRTDVSLLLGWGSYEQLRGGVELRRLNTFGIADQTRLQLVQSMKSSRGDLTFGVPDLFARKVNGSIRVFGLQRDEVAFERVEYGGSATLRRAWAARGYEISTGYTYESLNNDDDTLSPDAGDTDRTIAAAFNINLSRDRRDNPLSPKRGYNWYLQSELASHYFGGQADYQRYRAGFIYHTSWGRTRWIHAGLSQGAILPIGHKDTPLPVNKLFYPGGENSIRGYQDGEAAPRDENGAFLGAKVYTLLNLEFEQALVGSLNFVVFYDLLGDSASLTDYPGSEWLNSAGIGFRYHTILGPIRLEYGRNLNPRTGDPKGTLHFSVGVPF